MINWLKEGIAGRSEQMTWGNVRLLVEVYEANDSSCVHAKLLLLNIAIFLAIKDLFHADISNN